MVWAMATKKKKPSDEIVPEMTEEQKRVQREFYARSAAASPTKDVKPKRKAYEARVYVGAHLPVSLMDRLEDARIAANVRSRQGFLIEVLDKALPPAKTE